MKEKEKKQLKTGTIRQVVLIPGATPEAVYKALLSAKEHSEFTGSAATVNSRVGASFSAWAGYITGKNIRLEPGKKIVQEWKTSEWPEGYGPSLLTISLKKKGADTELIMRQSKVPASDVAKYDEGWHSSYWDPLKAYFHARAAP